MATSGDYFYWAKLEQGKINKADKSKNELQNCINAINNNLDNYVSVANICTGLFLENIKTGVRYVDRVNSWEKTALQYVDKEPENDTRLNLAKTYINNEIGVLNGQFNAAVVNRDNYNRQGTSMLEQEVKNQ